MSSVEYSTQEIESVLNDAARIVIVHQLDGVVWGLSVGSVAIFGFNTDEIAKYNFTNLSPKELVVNDICAISKIKKRLNITSIRNNFLFSFKELVRTIKLPTCDGPVSLVFWELSCDFQGKELLGQGGQFDDDESVALVSAYNASRNTQLAELGKLISKLQTAESFTLKSTLCKKLSGVQEEIAVSTDHLAECFSLLASSLKPVFRPFNNIGFIMSLCDVITEQGCRVHSIYDKNLPEYIYNDEKLLVTNLKNILCKIVDAFRPNVCNLVVEWNPQVNSENSMSIKCNLSECDISKHEMQLENTSMSALASSYNSSITMLLCKYIVHAINGDIQLNSLRDSLTIDIELPLLDVKKLDVAYDPEFIKGKYVCWVGEDDSHIYRQLALWGANIRQFHSLGMATAYLNNQKEGVDLCVIYDDEDAPLVIDLDQQVLDEYAKGILIICPWDEELISPTLCHASPDTTPARLANVLSLLLDTPLPYPHSAITYLHKPKKVNEIKVLIASGESETREMVSTLLSPYGLSVFSVSTGLDALQSCISNRFDLIFSDYELPYIDGIRLIKTSEAICEDIKNTPAILFGKDNSAEAKRVCKKAGYKMLLLKPIKSGAILGAVAGFIDILKPPDSAQAQLGEEVQAGLHSENYLDFPLINQQVLVRMAQDTNIDLRKEMVDMFIEESLLSISEIPKLCESEEFEELIGHVSGLRSASETFGCEALSVLTKQLANAVHSKQREESLRLAQIIPTHFLQCQIALYDFCRCSP